MELKVNDETTKVVGLPSAWRLEAEALGIDHGHDGDLGIAVWQVAAASASIVAALNDQMVLVVDPLAMAGGLNCCHHELILRTELFLASFLRLD